MALKPKKASPAPAFTQKRESVFKLKKETAGAFQYEEVNENGSKRTDMDGAIMGGMYIRKAMLRGAAAPELIKVTLDW